MKASRYHTRLLVAGAVAFLLPVAGALAQNAPQPPGDTQPQPQTSPTEPSPSQGSQQGATFDSLDTNGDGKISREEAAANANVSDQFSRYDQNGDGYIERSEVSAANHPPADNSGQ